MRKPWRKRWFMFSSAEAEWWQQWPRPHGCHRAGGLDQSRNRWKKSRSERCLGWNRQIPNHRLRHLNIFWEKWKGGGQGTVFLFACLFCFFFCIKMTFKFRDEHWILTFRAMRSPTRLKRSEREGDKIFFIARAFTMRLNIFLSYSMLLWIQHFKTFRRRD